MADDHPDSERQAFSNEQENAGVGTGIKEDPSGAEGDATEKEVCPSSSDMFSSEIAVSKVGPSNIALSELDPARIQSDIVLSEILRKQIRNLKETERQVEERLERQRVERLVEKVEEEVEYEGILDEMCSKIRAEEEAMEMERREREWELERREEALEEQVMLLKEKIRTLEDELKLAHAEKNYKEEMDDAIQRLLSEVHEVGMSDNDEPKDIEAVVGSNEEEKPSSSPSHAIIMAFEDMIKEADERHEREKRALEETIRAQEQNFRRERHKWRANEKQLESQMVAMEKEMGRLTSLLKEREHSLSLEKSRRKAVQEEATKFSSMLKDERLSHRVVVVKLKKLEAFVSKMKDKVAKEQDEQNSDFLKSLEKDIARMSAIFSIKKDIPKSMEAEQFEAVVQQRDAAIAERDKLEEKLNLLLKRSRDREGEIDEMWLERERILIEKLAGLEEQVEQWEIKCGRSEDYFLEKCRMSSWEQDTCTKEWEDEKRALQRMIRERDDLLKQLQEKIEAKDSDILKLRKTIAVLKKEMGEMDNDETSEVQSAVCDVDSESLFAKEEFLKKEKEKLDFERKQLETKLVETLSLVEELKSEMKTKEAHMEKEMKQMEKAIAVKTTEVASMRAEAENLRKQLDAKQVELDNHVNKFRSEMKLIEEEIMNERQERAKVLDSHFASKKNIAAEMKLKEEFWEKDMNRMAKEVTSLRTQFRKKTEELDSVIKERFEEASRFLQEKEKLLAANKEQEQEVVRLRLENAKLEKAAANESLEEKSNVEWQLALEKVAVFDRQISEAMQAIHTLREELCVKEAELQKARSEPEAELERREEAWMREREMWRKREQDILLEKAELMRSLESERSEASDTIALLHGNVRELHWLLTRNCPKDIREYAEDLVKSSKRADMVKVHASHLKELDQYIRELKAKVEELEKAKPGDKKVTRDEELDEALQHVEKEMLLRFSPERRFRVGFTEDSSIRTEKSSLTTTTSKYLAGPSDRTWNLGGPLSCMPKETVEERWLSQELPAPADTLTLALPLRPQKKWIIDTSWIEHVRKEHAFLRQQLTLERQRVAVLAQVEAENRWMEAMMLRAIQQKRECELKLSQLKQKVSVNDSFKGQRRGC